MMVSDIIRNTVNDIAREMELDIEMRQNDNSLTVFVKNNEVSYCPYIFNLLYEAESDQSISLYPFWSISRMFASGEKTDLYVLFANSMNIILKVVFNDSALVEYQGHVVCEKELGGATLFLQERVRGVKKQELSDKVGLLFEKYIAAMHMNYILFGSYGTNLRKNVNTAHGRHACR